MIDRYGNPDTYYDHEDEPERCPECGKPVEHCICDDFEDWEE